MARELFALIGEREPPIPIVAKPKQYKAKLQKANENVRWRETPFTNPVRRDDLELRHWVRTILDVAPPPPAQDAPAPTPMETDNADGEKNGAEQAAPESAIAQTEPKKEPQSDEYRFTKYNLQVEAPQYTDEEYTAHLVDPNWSREETDCLVETYIDFYGKWPVIVDRWDFKPTKTENADEAPSQAPTARSMEDLKARFYTVAAKMMAVHTPESKMTTAEFEDHEKMTKFNAEAETKRKRAADVLQHRSVEDRKEEDYLVAELRRIWTNQDRFATQLKELRERLDHSLTDDKGQASFSTHAEITALFQKVLANDRNRKRRPDGSTGANASPSTGPNAASGRGGDSAQQAKRQSTGGHGTSGPSHRTLGPRAELRFGVTSHDRLTSGVTFRSDKLNKVRQAKSQAQIKKIADVLAELGVPEIIQMPTSDVTTAMERLIGKVHLLLDARKMREKEENEILIEKQRRDIKAGKTTEEKDRPKAQEEMEDEDEVEVQPPKREEEDDDDDDEEDGGNGEDEDGEGDAEEEEEEEDEGEEDEEEEEQEEDADGGDDNEEQEEDGDGEDDVDELHGDGDGDEDTEMPSELPSEAPEDTPDASSRPETRNGKRSASVLSESSNVGTKRLRK